MNDSNRANQELLKVSREMWIDLSHTLNPADYDFKSSYVMFVSNQPDAEAVKAQYEKMKGKKFTRIIEDKAEIKKTLD